MGIRSGVVILLFAVVLAGCGGGNGDEAGQQPPESTAAGGTEPAGQATFVENCGGCHTLAAAGTSGAVGPNLDQRIAAGMLTKARVEEQVRNGGGGMPAFEGTLGDAEIAAVADYVVSAAAG